MKGLVKIDANKCIGCNACIRVCPVHIANIAQPAENGEHTVISIDEDKCIGCGACIKQCVHDARYYVDDTEQFIADIKSGKDITVLVAPAFVLTEPDAFSILNWLRQIGVKTIYDVSFGADICTYMHLLAIKERQVGKIISQPCAALTEYIYSCTITNKTVTRCTDT